MEIEFKCPHCKVVTFFDAAHVGENWNCRECGNRVTISASSRLQESEWLDDDEQPENLKVQDEIAPARITTDSPAEQPIQPGRFGLLLIVIAFFFATRLVYYVWDGLRSDTSRYRNFMVEQEAAQEKFRRELLRKFEEPEVWHLPEDELQKLRSNGHLIPTVSAGGNPSNSQ